MLHLVFSCECNHVWKCTRTKPDRGQDRPLIAADTVCVQANLTSSAGLIRVTHWLWSNNNPSQTISHCPAPQLRVMCDCVCVSDNHPQSKFVRSSCWYRCSWSPLGLPHRWLRSYMETTNMHVPLMRRRRERRWWSHNKREKKTDWCVDKQPAFDFILFVSPLGLVRCSQTHQCHSCVLWNLPGTRTGTRLALCSCTSHRSYRAGACHSSSDLKHWKISWKSDFMF